MSAPEKPTKNFSIRINSNGLCFICLTDITEVNGGDHCSPPTSFRLRNITRFLGIDTKKILKAYLDYDLKNCSDVKVELCKGCSEQVRKFNCLYQTLELTKLKLNECVRKISSLIKEAEEDCDGERTGEMARRVTHATTKGVIVDLRTGISKKCLELSKTVLPRVILKRLPEIELAKFSSQTRVAIGTDKESTPIKIEVSEEDDRSSIHNSASQMSDSDAVSLIPQKQHRTQIKTRLKALNKSCGPDGKSRCPFCKGEFPESKYLRLHLVNYHLQAYFFPEDECKQPSLSSQQFTEIVHYHLFGNIFTEHPTTKSVSRCPHCTKLFKKGDAGYFKLHIIQKHQELLDQRLDQLQKDPMLLEQLFKNTRWVCECGDQFGIGMLYNTHRNLFCNLLGNTDPGPTLAKQSLEILIDHQQVKPSVSQFPDGTLQTSCLHCTALFEHKLPSKLKQLLEIHLTASHLHTFFPEEDFKEPSLSSYQFQQLIYHQLFANISTDPENMNLLKCSNCNETAPKHRIPKFRMHVIKFHYESLVQRLKELQKDSMILKKLSKISEKFTCKCGVRCSNPKQYNRHRSKYCNLIEMSPTKAGVTPEFLKQRLEIVYQQSYSPISKSADGTLQKSCSHCNAVFKSKLLNDLNAPTWLHLASFHLHTFFPEDKHKDPLSSYQFKQVIHHFLFEHIGSEPDTKTKKIDKCPYCNVTIKKPISRLKVHLIKFHYVSLVQRLEELQKDALILEKLAKIGKAFTCECGDYFVGIKSFKLHRKKFCKLNAGHVETIPSRETHSSTSNTERDPLELDDEETFEGDDDHFSDSGDMYLEIGEVKPNISIEEEEIRTSERKRRGAEEPDPDSSSFETICVPRKVLKLELL